jgi:hypothetical protein
LTFPLDAYLVDRTPAEPPVAIELRTGDEPMVLETVDGKVRTRRGTVQKPDAVLSGRPAAILGLLSGRLDLGEANERGVEYSGPVEVLDRVCGDWAAVGPKS